MWAGCPATPPLLICSYALLQATFPWVPAVTATPAEGPPAKVSAEGRNREGAPSHCAGARGPGGALHGHHDWQPKLGVAMASSSEFASVDLLGLRGGSCLTQPLACLTLPTRVMACTPPQPSSHTLRPRSFPSPTKCLRCTSLMLGLGRQGLGCDGENPPTTYNFFLCSSHSPHM